VILKVNLILDMYSTQVFAEIMHMFSWYAPCSVFSHPSRVNSVASVVTGSRKVSLMCFVSCYVQDKTKRKRFAQI